MCIQDLVATMVEFCQLIDLLALVYFSRITLTQLICIILFAIKLIFLLVSLLRCGHMLYDTLNNFLTLNMSTKQPHSSMCHKMALPYINICDKINRSISHERLYVQQEVSYNSFYNCVSLSH